MILFVCKGDEMHPEDPIYRLFSAACVADRDGFATTAAALWALALALRVRCSTPFAGGTQTSNESAAGS